jgi:hypothetical protein
VVRYSYSPHILSRKDPLSQHILKSTKLTFNNKNKNNHENNDYRRGLRLRPTHNPALHSVRVIPPVSLADAHPGRACLPRLPDKTAHRQLIAPYADPISYL